MLDEINEVFQVSWITHSSIDIWEGECVVVAPPQLGHRSVPYWSHYSKTIGSVRQRHSSLAKRRRIVLNVFRSDRPTDLPDEGTKIGNLVGHLLRVALLIFGLTGVKQPVQGGRVNVQLCPSPSATGHPSGHDRMVCLRQ